MLASSFKRMARNAAAASKRTQSISRHLTSMTSASSESSEPPVLFESKLAMRKYTLNRPEKLNALDESMLDLLRPKIEEWNQSELCGSVVGSGVGRGFCAGGDVVNVVENAAEPSTRHKSIEFFQKEFETDYILAALKKPYVVIMDGFTMGGGVGLAVHAPFRVSTEKTVFAMPETKIGYCPDVGASYFLSRLDGEIGTYLGLTSQMLGGRDVFESGLATHYIPSRRVPVLLQRLEALESPSHDAINNVIEELSEERQPNESLPRLSGNVRSALDSAFGHNKVEDIMKDLEAFSMDGNTEIRAWAEETLAAMNMRSPTSLKVALEAIRKGKQLSLLEALNMELKIATAYCNGASPDFATGVRAVLVEKIKTRPAWSPSRLEDVSPADVAKFFSRDSAYLTSAPRLTLPGHLATTLSNPMQYALPSEEEIGSVVRGSHKSGGSKGLRLDELIARFEDLRGGKMGVKEKVTEVASRKCEVVDNADGNFVWLKWKYPAKRSA
ncbi:3-hydroxyisobutyryl-CoA hydrolase [Pleurotus ostreatus]|nr:3-hydroxyisobutyryl-CoA hydrolase [Pleurotus ostreatus]